MCAAGHELCREGDDADCMWLLQEGELIRMQAHMQQVGDNSQCLCLNEASAASGIFLWRKTIADP